MSLSHTPKGTAIVPQQGRQLALRSERQHGCSQQLIYDPSISQSKQII